MLRLSAVRRQLSVLSIRPPHNLRALYSSTSLRQQQEQRPQDHHQIAAAQGRSASDSEADEPARPNFYKQFGRPFAKVFLGAMLTYQVLYWGWEKMRIEEIKEERLEEMHRLQNEVDQYQSKKAV